MGLLALVRECGVGDHLLIRLVRVSMANVYLQGLPPYHLMDPVGEMKEWNHSDAALWLHALSPQTALSQCQPHPLSAWEVIYHWAVIYHCLPTNSFIYAASLLSNNRRGKKTFFLQSFLPLK